MELKKYTQEEFDAIPVDGFGIKRCPTGDYTAINCFGAHCSFGEGCSFGEVCSFGAHCSFGAVCRFGARCSFDAHCSFGAVCRFGAGCSFGVGCRFGEGCIFGEVCSFGAHCICEFGQFVSMLSAGGFGSCGRTTYFFLLSDGRICVRCGCFAGTLDEWAAKVKKTHGDSYIARAYLLLIPAVKTQFEMRGFCNG